MRDILHFEQHQAGEEALLSCASGMGPDGFLSFDLKDFPQWFQAYRGSNLQFSGDRRRPNPAAAVAIFVSKYDHCLVDLSCTGNVSANSRARIPLMISNHPARQSDDADFYGVPYHVVPVTKENKAEAERQEIELLAKNGIDLVCASALYAGAFSGFHQAVSAANHQLSSFVLASVHLERSRIIRRLSVRVKLIGATAHYVTGSIGRPGAIIEQGVTRISPPRCAGGACGERRDLEKNGALPRGPLAH